jgi:hypothetical protein
MRELLRRVGGAVAMAVAWAAVWGLVGGGDSRGGRIQRISVVRGRRWKSESPIPACLSAPGRGFSYQILKKTRLTRGQRRQR